MKGQLLEIFAVIGVIGIGVALFFAMPSIKLWLDPYVSASKIVDKTYDADNAIYNYEWFKAQHEKIIAIQAQVDNTKVSIKSFDEFGNKTDWSRETTDEYLRQKALLLGLQNQEENLITDYDARASMANRQIFNDKLPLNIDKRLR